MKKRFFFIILVIFIIFFLQCPKNRNKNQGNENQNINPEINDNKGIDFIGMKKIVDNSKKLDIDVFFAISVLHKQYTLQLVDTAKNLPEEEQKSFFDSKKKEFFKSIKYSEQDYDKFMETHIDEMNDYIINHKVIADYLNSENF